MTDDNHLDFEVNGEIIAVIKRHKANTATMAREIAITARQLDEAQADIEKLRADLEAAKVELLKAQIENNRTYCAYCGTEFLLDDDAAKNVTDHIKTCKKHPMRAVESELAQAREILAPLEWDNHYMGQHGLCPYCGQTPMTGHMSECKINAVLHPERKE